MEKKVDILGTTYTVHTSVAVSADPALKDLFGYCCATERKIVIADINTIDNWKDESNESKTEIVKQTMRHEVIHAFFAESGLRGSTNNVCAWATNEEMVDWFAIQYPKIKKVFVALRCE